MSHDTSSYRNDDLFPFQDLYYHEVRKLLAYQERMKDERDKAQVTEVMDVQSRLYTAYAQDAKPFSLGSRGLTALLMASQRGLAQLSYLLLTLGSVPCDAVVDAPTLTTAFHQAAAHGNTNIVALLLSRGVNPCLTDRYGQTPLHLAAMFGHALTFQYIASVHSQEVQCRAGTTPSQIYENFKRYLQLHKKDQISQDSDDIWGSNDSGEAMQNILKNIRFSELVDDTNGISIDFNSGEAREIRDVIIQECEMIADKIRDRNSLYAGEIRLVGSSADGTRLYAPDEFDISLVLSNVSDFRLQISELSKYEISQTHHKLRLNVKTPHVSFQGCQLIDTFHELIEKHLSENSLCDERLSLVPPGLRKTHVGSTMALSWQGTTYPLLLVNVDFVPVVVVPWHPRIRRPFLTPDDLHQVYLSNTSDGEWRLSFSEAEVAVLSDLEEEERLVYLACKTLLSRMKAEPWMPSDVKRHYTWWDFRTWHIPLATGFAFKNSFLRQLEIKRKEGVRWTQRELPKWMLSVFRGMCSDVKGREATYAAAKVKAYFGGDFEKPKTGEGAPEISQFLSKCANVESAIAENTC